MRTRALIAGGVIALLSLGSLGVPAQAAEKKFEGTILMPAPVLGPEEYADLACGEPDGGPLNGITYAWVDLKADYKKFQMDGPKDLFREPDPTGAVGGPFGDHDLDWYFYDTKCTNLTTHSNVGESRVKAESRKPARYVLVIYWTGIHPELPYIIKASN